MFINYYFPLRAPGGLLAEVYRLSTVYRNFSKYRLSIHSHNFYYTRYYYGGGENTYKKYTYFYFLWGGGIFYLAIPSTCVLCT